MNNWNWQKGVDNLVKQAWDWNSKALVEQKGQL